MSEIYLISDTHFGHRNIIEYEKEFRPFSTIEEHDEALIDYWNETVTPQDIVYHLGDFAFGKRNVPIAEKLNGNKHLIMGNHDIYGVRTYLEYFDKVYPCKILERCLLTHIPIHPVSLGRYTANVHGHLHHKESPEGNYVNVSCEQTDLRPIPFDEIYNRLKVSQ